MSLKVFYIRLWLIGVMLLVYGLGFGQTVIFDESGGGSAPSGWSFQNNQTNFAIDRGSYWLVEQGSPLNDIIITDTYDLSSYTSAQFTLDVATFGGGANNAAIIEFSTDGGSSFTQTETTNTPTSTSYINGGTFILNSLSNQVVIRITHDGTFGQGVRLQNLILTGLGGAPSGYCSSSFTSLDADAITNVTLNTLINSSGDAHASNADGYEDFTSLAPTDLQQGQTYNLSVSIDPNGVFTYDVWVFLDWDSDEDFDGGIDESYDLGDRNTPGILTTNITVPSGSSLSNTRMRVVMVNADDPLACDPQNWTFGETEDYTVNVISSSACNILSPGLSNITCNDNGTSTNTSDDVISFQLNPTGNNLGSTYSVDTDGIAFISDSPTGPFDSFVISGNNYGSPTTFYLEPGSAGDGDIDTIVYDDTDNNCLEIPTVNDPGACSFGGGTTCGVEIDFETQGAGYSTSITEFTDNATDYFTQTSESDISASFTGTDGRFFAAQDIDDQGASLPVELTINNIDISNLINLEFSIDLAEDDDGFSEDWDEPDYVRIYYSIDGGTEQNLLWIESELSSGTNGRPLIDTDFDGVGDGTEITDNFTEFVQSIGGTGSTMDIRIEFSLNSGDEDIAIDNISVCGTNNNIDADSFVNDPGQIPSGTITADQTTLFSTAVDVFKFEVQDLGTSDGLDTVIEQFRLVPGSENTASWSQIIKRVRVIAEGSGGVVEEGDHNLTINDNEIIVEITDTPQSEMTTDNNDTREYTIRVYLNETEITDQEIIQFALPAATTDWVVGSNSSQFVTNFTPFEGGLFTIDVVGDGLEFLSNASTTIVNETMSTVIVANPDVNGNIDRELTNDVNLITSGPLVGSNPVTVTPVDGIATFDNLVHDAIGNDFTFTASSSGLPDIVSNVYDIIALPELFITEIADPHDNTSGKFVEIYNSGITEIDFNTSEYYLVRESNGGPVLNALQLTGVIEPKEYYIIGSNQYNTVYSIDSNLTDPDPFGGTVAGNGDDTYFLSKDNYDDLSLRSSLVEIYGELGVDGTLEPWVYASSRAYRNNPTVKNANNIWTASEWTIENNTDVADMTPGYGDNDYIYDGAWSNTGLQSDPNGVSTSSQNIFVLTGSVTLNGDVNGDLSVGDLVVRSGAILTLAPNVKLTVAGDILNEGTIIFDSDANSTAVLEALPSTTRVVGNGFEVRRYIPVVQNPNPIRAFRYLSSSVDTQNSAKPTINDNWQEGAASASENPNPGFGTHITGSSTGENGFDATQTGNPSMFFWDPAEDLSTAEVDQVGWTSVPNTDVETFGIGDAFAILVRGDRNAPLDSNTAVGNSTILRTTGELHYGELNLGVSDLASQDFFTLVGNPYQSQVDLKEFITSLDLDKNVYIYDPTVGDLGVTITLDLSAENVTPMPASSANQFLQPNQAFVVKTIGSSPQINFTESTKNNTGSQTGVFNEQPDDITQLDISIKNANQELQDGIRIVYGDTYSNTVNYDDATKLFNSGETIAIESSSAYLSIEKRDWPTPPETTNLNLYNLTLSDYVLSLDFQTNNPNMPEVYLVDHYTGQNTLVSTNALTNYSFSVDANIPESIASDRFQLTYSSSLSVDNFENESFLVYPNPLKPSDLVSITSKDIDLETIKSIEINTIQGKIIRSIPSSKLTKYGNSVQLKLNSTISKGTYFLKIIAKENNYICKLIIN